MKSITLTLLLCGLITTAGLSQTTPSKSDNIRKLLELTGSAKLSIQAMQGMIASFKQAYPSVTDDFWNDFLKEVNADVLNKMIVPIYEKYYTEEDVKQMIAFYETPVGKKADFHYACGHAGVYAGRTSLGKGNCRKGHEQP